MKKTWSLILCLSIVVCAWATLSRRFIASARADRARTHSVDAAAPTFFVPGDAVKGAELSLGNLLAGDQVTITPISGIVTFDSLDGVTNCPYTVDANGLARPLFDNNGTTCYSEEYGDASFRPDPLLADPHAGLLKKLNNSYTFVGATPQTFTATGGEAFYLGINDTALSAPNTGGFNVRVRILRGTAAPAAISGRITTPDGLPLGGATVHLDGGASHTTISDNAGAYHFDNLDTGSFYTVTPARANYSITPSSRSFSLAGNRTDATFTATADRPPSANPLDDAGFFVRQHYLDFLGREPDAGGFEYWLDQIAQCGPDQTCVPGQRIAVSNAFFYAAEFQESGAFVYRVYKAAFGQRPRFAEFQTHRAQIIGGPNLNQSKMAFVVAFVQRSAFTQIYPQSQSAEQFVDALLENINQNSSVDLSAQRPELIAHYDGTDTGRAAIVRQIADNSAFIDAEYNRSFVLTEYFGYLSRDPDEGGYDFWLNQVNNYPLRDVSIQHAMVCSFITSAEYQLRFGTVVSHTNGECQ